MMTASQIIAHAQSAADFGLVPAYVCPYSHKEQPEQHREWMRAYTEWANREKDDGK